jgi:hypothetical protein
LALGTPVDRVLIDWTAQPGKVAEILLTRDPRGLDGQNTPAKQLVFQGQSRLVTSRGLTLNAFSSSQVFAPDTNRTRAIIKALPVNTDRILLGQTPINAGNGMPLEPGESLTLYVSGQLRAVSASGNQELRILEEFL